MIFSFVLKKFKVDSVLFFSYKMSGSKLYALFAKVSARVLLFSYSLILLILLHDVLMNMTASDFVIKLC